MAEAGREEWPAKSGYMLKMGNNALGSLDWKKRWVDVRANGVLYYYKNRADTSPAGRIILKDCTVKAGNQRAHCIGLTIQGRTYYFATETKAELDQWMRHLDKELASKLEEGSGTGDGGAGSAGSQGEERILEGWLYKMGNNAVKDWPKRWVILHKDRLTYWRRKDDNLPAGTIKLASLHVVTADNVKPNCLEFVTPTRCYYFHADEPSTIIRWAMAIDAESQRVREGLGEDVLSAMETEDLHAKRVAIRAQKSGMLGKAGKNVLQQWPKRFVLLRDDLLYYYKSSSDDKPLGVINLMLCTVKPNVPEKKFDVILPTRVYHFSCDSSQECAEWAAEITKAHEKIYDNLEAKSASMDRGLKMSGIAKYQTGASVDSSPAEAGNVLCGEEAKGGTEGKVEDNTAKDELLEFVKIPGNNTCADCKAPEPRWAAINLGIFICIECSGIHRSLGVHISKVRSVDMDKWSRDIVDFMKSMGNDKFNREWEKFVPQNTKPAPDAPRNERESYIEKKYNGVFKDEEKAAAVALAGKGEATPKQQKNYYKEGFITKQGNSVKTWKKRWFVVKTTGNSASLYYYKSKGDKMPAGIIPLTTADLDVNPSVKEKYALEIITPNRVFPVSFTSEAEKREWVEHLKMVMADFKNI